EEVELAEREGGVTPLLAARAQVYVGESLKLQARDAGLIRVVRAVLPGRVCRGRRRRLRVRVRIRRLCYGRAARGCAGRGRGRRLRGLPGFEFAHARFKRRDLLAHLADRRGLFALAAGRRVRGYGL